MSASIGRAVLVFGTLGGLTGFFIASGGKDVWSTFLAALLGAGLMARVLWRFAVRPEPTVLKGTLIGLAIGVASHLPFALVFLLIKLALGTETFTPWLLTAPIFMGLLGIVLTGWITGPVGAVAGAALAAFERRR